MNLDEAIQPSRWKRLCSRRASSASLLRIAEEGPGPGPDSLAVVDSSPSPTRRKKSLSWKGDDDVVSPAPVGRLPGCRQLGCLRTGGRVHAVLSHERRAVEATQMGVYVFRARIEDQKQTVVHFPFPPHFFRRSHRHPK